MDTWIDGRTDGGWMVGCMDGWMGRFVGERIHLEMTDFVHH